MISKKSKQREVTCPHCQSSQTEPEGAISTNCRSCGKYFKLASAKNVRSARAPKASREVFCVKCGAPNLVSPQALSTQCIRCLHYLELGDKVVRGVQTGKLYAYDDVVFAEGCSFRGMEATGRRIEVRGKVFSKLRAQAEIVAFGNSQLSGDLHAPLVRIERGAKVKVQNVECGTLQVSGDLEISGHLLVTEVILNDGANFIGQLQMPEGKLSIGAGVSTHFQSLTCDELIADGEIVFREALSARKISIGKGGSLKAPRISVSNLEVSVGGILQGHIEKYVPRIIVPEETAEPEGGTEPEAVVEPPPEVPVEPAP